MSRKFQCNGSDSGQGCSYIFWSKTTSDYETGRRHLEPIPWRVLVSRTTHQIVLRDPLDRPKTMFSFPADNYRGQETCRKSLQSQSAADDIGRVLIREGSSRKRNGTSWRILRRVYNWKRRVRVLYNMTTIDNN